MAGINSSLSKSQSFANLGSLKLLQVQLLDWAATWAKTSDLSIPPMSVDMPDVVTLLQGLGYKLRKLEAHAPQDISNVSVGGSSCNDVSDIQDRGVRVVVTCGHSGQVCVLESPLAASNCRCVKIPDGDTSGDCFWEVTSVGGKNKGGESSLIESGCDALPAVSKEVNILVANVLNYLCDRIIGNKELEQVEIPLKDTPVSSKTFGRFSDSVTITTQRGTGENITPLGTMGGLETFRKTPCLAVSSAHQNGTDSPARYRSLDTLTSANADKILPEPGHLVPKDQLEVKKSMDLLSIEDPHESSSSTIGDTSFNSTNISKLKEAHKLIQDIASSIEENKLNPSNVNKLNEVYKMIGEIALSITNNNLNSTNFDKLKKAEKIIADIIHKLDKKNTSTDKEKRKSNSASNIIQKIMRGPKIPTSAQARAKMSNSSPNLESGPAQAKVILTTKNRNRIGSSSSVIEKTEMSTVKKRPVARSNTDVAKQPIVLTAKKSTSNKNIKYANVKSTIPKPEPSKRKE